MEEKNKKMKVASINGKTAKETAPTQEKLTYEQLENIANNLNSQCRKLYSDLQEAQKVIDNFNVIGMLLSVLGKSEYYSEDFVQRCSEKTQELVGAVLDSMEAGENKGE